MQIVRIRYIVMVLLTMTAVWSAPAQTTDSLPHYLETAALHHPGLKAEFLAYKASLQRIAQAGAYQDPELEMGMFLEPMEIIGGKQVAEFKLMQMFAWFGTRRAAESEATHMARMEFEKFRETRDNLYLEVSTQWYLLCNLQQKLLNYRHNKELLLHLEQLAIRKFSSPSSASGAGMSNVLRIRLEIAELDNSIESILSELIAEKARFNALLNRRAESNIEVPETFEQIDFLFDADSAVTTIGNQSPMLGMIQAEELAYVSKAEMDKKMGYPMFGVGLQYMLNQVTDNPMFSMGDMNGKDMLMPMVSLTIPVYRQKYKALQRESKYLEQAAREKYTQTYNALASEWYKTKHLLDDASRKITLYAKQSELALTTSNLAVQEFVAGKSDLSDVILIHRQLLDYQLKKAEAVAGYNTMVASVKKLLSFSDTEQNVNNLYHGNE